MGKSEPRSHEAVYRAEVAEHWTCKTGEVDGSSFKGITSRRRVCAQQSISHRSERARHLMHRESAANSRCEISSGSLWQRRRHAIARSYQCKCPFFTWSQQFCRAIQQRHPTESRKHSYRCHKQRASKTKIQVRLLRVDPGCEQNVWGKSNPTWWGPQLDRGSGKRSKSSQNSWLIDIIAKGQPNKDRTV